MIRNERPDRKMLVGGKATKRTDHLLAQKSPMHFMLVPKCFFLFQFPKNMRCSNGQMTEEFLSLKSDLTGMGSGYMLSPNFLQRLKLFLPTLKAVNCAAVGVIVSEWGKTNDFRDSGSGNRW